MVNKFSMRYFSFVLFTVVNLARLLFFRGFFCFRLCFNISSITAREVISGIISGVCQRDGWRIRIKRGHRWRSGHRWLIFWAASDRHFSAVHLQASSIKIYTWYWDLLELSLMKTVVGKTFLNSTFVGQQSVHLFEKRRILKFPILNWSWNRFSKVITAIVDPLDALRLLRHKRRIFVLRRSHWPLRRFYKERWRTWQLFELLTF